MKANQCMSAIMKALRLNQNWVQIFAKQAKIWVSEIFMVLIFVVSESGTRRLAGGMAKS